MGLTMGLMLKEAHLYSARLYTARKRKAVIFCMCLSQPQYIKCCDEEMAARYKIQEKERYLLVRDGVTITAEEVCLKQNCPKEWKTLCTTESTINKNAIEIHTRYEPGDCNFPRIEIAIKNVPRSRDAEPLELRVEGLNVECVFRLPPEEFLPFDVDTTEIRAAMEELEEEIKGQSSEWNNILSIATQMLEHMECILKLLQAQDPHSFSDSVLCMLRDMDGESRLLRDEAKKTLTSLKVTFDMEAHVEDVSLYSRQLKVIYLVDIHHSFESGTTSEWHAATSLFITNAANLMSSIKDVLKASKSAQSLPNNHLDTTPQPHPLPSRQHICSEYFGQEVPTIEDLCITVIDDLTGKRFNLSNHISDSWKTIGLTLGMELDLLNSIGRNRYDDAERLMMVFIRWLENAAGLPHHARYPLSWQGLNTLLKDIGKTEVAKQYFEFLESTQVLPNNRLFLDTTHPLSDRRDNQVKTKAQPPNADVIGESKYKADSQQFIKAVEDAIAKSGKINRRLAHSIVIGPPGSGKSSLIDRLLKRLRRMIAKSTGVCNSVIIVDIDEINPSSFHAATGLDTETWKAVDYEVSIVNQLGEKSSEKPASPEHVVHNQLTPVKKPSEKVKSKISIWPKKEASPLPQKKHAVAVIAMSAEKVTSIIEKYGFETFRNYLQKTFSLYLRDTGGQVEFQEMLPLLISGPSIFFFVFRVDLDFQSKFTVEYRTGESKPLNSYTSSITTEEALLQCLASVYAMDTTGGVRVKTHKPLVFIVGTHTDQLGQSADAKIIELDERIDLLIKKNGFQNIVQYADKNQNRVIFPVDNTSESDKAFKKIRSSVNSLIYGREEFAIEYPVSYLLLCLDLQNEKRNILTMGDFRVLALRQGIEGDDVFHLLQFLHLRIGIVRYYDAEGLRDIIVIEPQVLFNTITNLVVKTFSCKALTSSEVSEFEKKGLFTASVLKSVINSSALSREIASGDSISVDKFVQLLVHLRIITPFTAAKDQEVKYFIPCVLNHVPESTEEAPKTDILPLAVKFQCQHSPKGIFGVLVSHLLTPSVDNASGLKFLLMEDEIFKDQVSFEVDFSGELSLTIYSSHLEIKFFPYSSEDSNLSIEEICCSLREILEESIHSSLRDLHYSEERVQPKMCFKCQDCLELHPVTKGKQFHRISCRATRKIIRLPPQARCWYGEKVSSESTPNLEDSERINARGSSASNKSFPSTLMRASAEIDGITEEEFARASEILKRYSHKWRMIGEGLGFKACELDHIMSRPLLLLDAPNSYLSAMLSGWRLWAPGDHRGSNTYATLHSLSIAVDKAGLGLTAQELA